MPDDRPSLLDESTLAPFELDLRLVFRAMTTLWGLALFVVGVLAATHRVEMTVVWICATGVVLGFAAMGWRRWRFRDAPPA